MAEMDHAQVEDRMWKAISDDRLGMLGLTGPDAGHFQPMSAYHEQETHHLWFFSYADNKLSAPLGDGKTQEAMFHFVDKERQVWACIMGALSSSRSRAHLDKFWDSQAQAWFAEGKDDLKLTMLRFEPRQAEVWINEKGLVRYGLGVLKANLGETTPDPGVHQTIQLS
ncbi:MAG: pyridoxamine 5'-phosphate oxidase family protein [Pseudomonadota bacterium]|nr:pyridoxamine 5'-phosphate oxidase family protein [Pseudomonadota bacterium]